MPGHSKSETTLEPAKTAGAHCCSMRHGHTHAHTAYQQWCAGTSSQTTGGALRRRRREVHMFCFSKKKTAHTGASHDCVTMARCSRPRVTHDYVIRHEHITRHCGAAVTPALPFNTASSPHASLACPTEIAQHPHTTPTHPHADPTKRPKPTNSKYDAPMTELEDRARR